MLKKWKKEIARTIKQTNLARVLVFILFFVWCASFVIGFLWVVISSLNEHVKLMTDPISFPQKLHFENWLKTFEVLTASGSSFEDMVFNSLWYMLGGTAIQMSVYCMAGYSLWNFKFKGRNAIVAAIIIILMIPIYGAGSATMIMYNQLRMYNSPLMLLASTGAVSGTTLIVMTFFQGLSPAYEEAAKMDGAGYWSVFLKIHLPMILPSLGAIALLDLIARWNDYSVPLYYLPDYPTLSTGLYIYETTSKFSMDKPVYFAGVILCSILPIVLFSVFREKLMTSVTIGGVK